MTAGLGFNKLPADPQTLTGLTHAPFQDIAHTEVASDLLGVNGTAFECEARVSRDNEEPPNLGQCCDDLVGDAVRQILLFWIAAEVCEGKHNERGLVRQRQCPEKLRRKGRRCCF
jgi:hypothetical protein